MDGLGMSGYPLVELSEALSKPGPLGTGESPLFDPASHYLETEGSGR